MNWIKVSSKRPDNIPGEDYTKSCFIWVLEEWETNIENGYADSGYYSKFWRGWIAEEGTLEQQGRKVTHWAEIEPPI